MTFSAGTRRRGTGHAVLHAAQAHELVAALHRDAPVALDHERGDAAPVPLAGHPAITTSRSATTPLVAHSFTPLSMYPPVRGIAVVVSRAGSEPTSGSVSRNAEISPRANRGR